MGYARLKTVREWMKDGTGSCEPLFLTEMVNAARQHFFNWYAELSLFLDAVECFGVQSFCLDCNDCNSTYQGVTLPREMAQVEAMWFNNFPVKLQTSWREYQIGIVPECACGLEKYDIPGFFSTQLDIPNGRPSKLILRCFDPRDAGKKLTVRGMSAAGVPLVQTFALGTEPQMNDTPFRYIEAQGGVFKERTQGRVVMMDEFGRVLGMYEPDETDPAYHRIKITGVPSGCEVVNIRASRKYVPLYGDDDTVESDNQLAFDSMARFLRLYRKSDQTGDDIKVMQAHLSTARQMMSGEKSRELGRTTRAEIVIATPAFPGRRLGRFGNNGRFRWG